MTQEQRKKIRDIKAKIRATAEVLVQYGNVRAKDGRLTGNVITDLFTELREIEAVCGPDVY